MSHKLRSSRIDALVRCCHSVNLCQKSTMLFQSISRLRLQSFPRRTIRIVQFHINCNSFNGNKLGDVSEYKIINEGKAEILQPSCVFYNPVQEFGRDLTVAAVANFVQIRQQEIKDGKFKKGQYLTKTFQGNSDRRSTKETSHDDEIIQAGKKYENEISILEGLSASGLRSIRFGLEVPGVKRIVTNDFDKAAVDIIQKNIERNKLDHLVTSSLGDASMVMHMSKGTDEAFDVIDVDPYGSPAQFLDAAVQSINEGGLLCVTCTDMAVLCGNNPESCRARYGTMSHKSSYCKEMALRILLQSIETTANKYTRYIVPMISIRADFYIRVFVRVFESAEKVKLSSLKFGNVYHCMGCGSFTLQKLARKIPKRNAFHIVAEYGPPVSDKCEHCNQRHQVVGPVWADRLHDVDFVNKVINYVQENKDDFQTHRRIMGMLSLISEELQDSPMYYLIEDLCKAVHISQMKQQMFMSALLNAGFEVSMSHAEQNSIKTNASNRDIWDIIRSWEKLHPARQLRLVPGSVAANILSQDPVLDVSFDQHPGAKQESKKAA
ncbi:tRNA (guanine(26)-N(2))-dimethyltransferase-like isoform X2 [Argopecten irradians]|uniref:tRNA (guanine(26)-N(2))-dimethyltransferase-like isoform X2 n=1 Tax=Argopecten irradians TaxID=31199 RepID=UPI003722D636